MGAHLVHLCLPQFGLVVRHRPLPNLHPHSHAQPRHMLPMSARLAVHRGVVSDQNGSKRRLNWAETRLAHALAQGISCLPSVETTDTWSLYVSRQSKKVHSRCEVAIAHIPAAPRAGSAETCCSNHMLDDQESPVWSPIEAASLRPTTEVTLLNTIATHAILEGRLPS